MKRRNKSLQNDFGKGIALVLPRSGVSRFVSQSPNSRRWVFFRAQHSSVGSVSQSQSVLRCNGGGDTTLLFRTLARTPPFRHVPTSLSSWWDLVRSDFVSFSPPQSCCLFVPSHPLRSTGRCASMSHGGDGGDLETRTGSRFWIASSQISCRWENDRQKTKKLFLMGATLTRWSLVFPPDNKRDDLLGSK